MKLENEKVESNLFYAVGYCKELEKYVLALTVTWISYYNQYFEISEEEFNSFEAGGLNDLARSLRQNMKSDRFLFSEFEQENTPEQRALRDAVTSQQRQQRDNEVRTL